MNLKHEQIELFGEQLIARELSLAEFSAFADFDAQLANLSDYAKGMRRAFWILPRAILKHDWTPRYEAKDLEEMGQSQAADIARAYATVWRLSGLSDESREEQSKNSEPGPTVSD